jgi:hypothetical protein
MYNPATLVGAVVKTREIRQWDYTLVSKTEFRVITSMNLDKHFMS